MKSGYRYSRDNKLTADGQEHQIIIRSALTVTGTVTDSDTGEPLRC